MPRRHAIAGGLLFWLTAGSILAQPPDPLADARAALREGHTTQAVALADVELRRDPTSRPALVLKIEALTSAKDWETALDVYDALLSADGQDDRRLLEEIARAFLREMVALYPQIRVMSLSRLACAGDREALLDLRRALPQARPDDIEALTVRARLGDYEGVLALRDLAASGPPPSRALALQALQRVKDRGAGRVVTAAVDHEDLFLRLTGVRAARVLAVESARPRLQALVNDPNHIVAAEAAAALAALGEGTVTDRLKALQTSPSPDVRVAALTGLLWQAPDPQWLASLEALARTRNGSAWLAALEVLLERAPARAGNLVREALTDPNPNVRILALRLFPRLGRPELRDLAPLRTQLREPQNFVKMEAATALLGPSDLCLP